MRVPPPPHKKKCLPRCGGDTHDLQVWAVRVCAGRRASRPLPLRTSASAHGCPSAVRRAQPPTPPPPPNVTPSPAALRPQELPPFQSGGPFFKQQPRASPRAHQVHRLPPRPCQSAQAVQCRARGGCVARAGAARGAWGCGGRLPKSVASWETPGRDCSPTSGHANRWRLRTRFVR